MKIQTFFIAGMSRIIRNAFQLAHYFILVLPPKRNISFFIVYKITNSIFKINIFNLLFGKINVLKIGNDALAFLEKSLGRKLQRRNLLPGSDGFLIKDNFNKLIFRISEKKEGIYSNYHALALLSNHRIGNIPRPIKIKQFKALCISIEEYKFGDRVSVKQIDINLITKVLLKLDEINNLVSYPKQHQPITFQIKINKYFDIAANVKNNTIIEKLHNLRNYLINSYSRFSWYTIDNIGFVHGDLTYRNILLQNDKVVLLDFDRFEYNNILIDLLTIYTDLQTHKMKIPEFDDFFHIINNLFYNNALIDFISTLKDKELQARYFKTNNFAPVIGLFFFRALSYSIETYFFTFGQSKTFKMLEHIHGFFIEKFERSTKPS